MLHHLYDFRNGYPLNPAAPNNPILVSGHAFSAPPFLTWHYNTDAQPYVLLIPLSCTVHTVVVCPTYFPLFILKEFDPSLVESWTTPRIYTLLNEVSFFVFLLLLFLL